MRIAGLESRLARLERAAFLRSQIVTLREKMSITQRELADRLGVTVTSISRYENGKEPSRQVLRNLADIAQVARLSDLSDAFTRACSLRIAARIEKLPSIGTQRRVSLCDLKRWKLAIEAVKELREIAEEIGVYVGGQS
jgi:transcriptional regulator with XRE-family HTH domain